MNISDILKNWKTSVLGVLPLILAVLVGFGVITVEQQQAVIDGTTVVFDGAASAADEVIAVIAAIVGVIGLFSKDGDKDSNEEAEPEA